VIRLDLEKKQAVRKADREHRTMLQYKTLLAESKTPLLLAQKEIASLQKELDGFRKAVDAKAKERDAMERAAKFAQAETEKVWRGVLTPSPRHRIAATARHRDSPRTGPKSKNKRPTSTTPGADAPRRPSAPLDRIHRHRPSSGSWSRKRARRNRSASPTRWRPRWRPSKMKLLNKENKFISWRRSASATASRRRSSGTCALAAC